MSYKIFRVNYVTTAENFMGNSMWLKKIKN